MTISARMNPAGGEMTRESTVFQNSEDRTPLSPCAAAIAAPLSAPTKAWVELLGRPRYQVMRFQAIAPIKAAMMTTRPTEHWVQRMHAEGVPYAPVQTLPEVLRSEQVAALGAISRLTHQVAGEIPIVRLPLTMSGAHVTATDPPPALDGDVQCPRFDRSGAQKYRAFSTRFDRAAW